MASGFCRLPMLIALVVIASCVAPFGRSGPSDARIAGRLGQTVPLMPLFAALWQREAGVASVVPVVQLGDSHTANDAFSGRMRELFQARFGDAGRGLLPPGIPHAYYRPDRIGVTAQGWTGISSADPRASGPFGLAGLRQHADGPAVMTYSASGQGDLGVVEVEFLRQSGGGTIVLEAGNAPPVFISTGGTQDIAWVVAPPSADSQTFEVRAKGDGPVDLLGWAATRGVSGVTYSNLGTIGASIALLDRWDDVIVQRELSHLSPALIVIAFGTNEGFRDATNPDDYAAVFEKRLRVLHTAAPDAALLVVGPPDGARHRREGVSDTGDCGDSGRGVSGWETPPRLASIRAAQRQSAEREGAFFWDWWSAMGGACSILRWASARPPLAAADHVHMLLAGYRQSAEALFGTIFEGYGRYRALRGSPP